MTTTEFRAGVIWHQLTISLGPKDARDLLRRVDVHGLSGDDLDAVEWLQDHLPTEGIADVIPIRGNRQRHDD